MSISFTMFPEEIVSLQRVADSFGLMFRMPSDSTAYLCGEEFVVSITVDRDGAEVWYFDAADATVVKGYAIGFLLFQKRNSVPMPDAQFPNNVDRVRYELQWVIAATVQYGSDVLHGSRDWFAEYTLEIQTVIGGLRDRILTALTLRKAMLAQQNPKTPPGQNAV